MQKSTTAAVTIQVRASILRSRRRPTTIAATPPTAAIQVASAGPPSSQPGPEVAGKRELQRDARGERGGQHERSHQCGEHRRSTGEREWNRDEAGETPRLRNRDRVGEVRKHPRKQLDAEHGERSAEHEGRPALPRGERGEWNEHEPGHGDGAAARDHLRTKRVVMQRADVELVCRISSARARARPSTASATPSRGRAAGARRARRRPAGRAPRAPSPSCAASLRVSSDAGDGEAEQRDAEEDGRARVDEQHLDADRGKREAEHPAWDAAGRGRRA